MFQVTRGCFSIGAPFNKMELQLYNLRHLQHHTGQLAARLRTAANLAVTWVSRFQYPIEWDPQKPAAN